jgi:RNA polymerase sigma-54 factor
MERILHVIHELEPSGVGSEIYKHVCLLQPKHKTPTEYVDLATDTSKIMVFTKKHYDKLILKYSTNEQLKSGFNEIEKLNPKPGGSFTGK